MTTYNLDETVDVFIAPYESKKMCYQMVRFSERPNQKIIGDIDLNKDKLIIYGTEIKETAMLQKLYDSLRLGSSGTVFVNCNGECNIWISKSGFDRLHHNITFDWSPFGVVVPNSFNNILRKELQQKDKEVKVMWSLLEASKKEMEELKEQLSSCRNDHNLELQKVPNQLSSIEAELKSIKSMVEMSKLKEKVIELDEQLCKTNKESEEMKTKLQNMQDRVSVVEVDLQLTKTQLESSDNKIIELEQRLSSFEKEGQVKEAKVQDQLSIIMADQVKSINISFEFDEAKAMEDQSCFRECNTNKAVEIVDE